MSLPEGKRKARQAKPGLSCGGWLEPAKNFVSNCNLPDYTVAKSVNLVKKGYFKKSSLGIKGENHRRPISFLLPKWQKHLKLP